MERDFMGLSSKGIVKEEVCNFGFNEIGIQWPVVNKMANAQAANAKNMGDFMSFPIAGPKADVVQVLNQPVMVPSRIPIFESQVLQNWVNNPVKEHGGGFPFATPVSWGSVKASGPSTQLTLFYAGAVCVYDDISPDKVQAIMSLAMNAASIAASAARPKLQVQRPSSKPVPDDVVPNNQTSGTPPSSRVSSPLSASSHTGFHSRSGSTCTDEGTAAKTGGVSTPISKVEPPKMVHAFASVAPSIPQARKASLARFLEKRKERVMNGAPYNLSKKCPERSASESRGMNLGASSSAVDHDQH